MHNSYKLKHKHKRLDRPDGKCCVDHMRFFCFVNVFLFILQDVRTALDTIHLGGALKERTEQNLSLYLKKNEKVPLAFRNMRANGVKIFLLTNSDFQYTNKIMKYLFEFPDVRKYATFLYTKGIQKGGKFN